MTRHTKAQPIPSAIKTAERNIIVGVADLGVSNDPAASIVTYSLGSCLGVAIYDPILRVGGILHAMLPSCGADVEKARQNPSMFLDSGVPALFRSAYRLGADKHRIVVKAAGGAELLVEDQFFAIGLRNYEVLLETLERNRVTLSAAAVGGRASRTMRLEVATGKLTISVPGEASIEL